MSPNGVAPGVSRRFNPALYVVVAVAFAGLVLVTTVLLEGLMFGVASKAYEPDTELRPDMAAAGAAWGGFPDTTGMQLVSLQHDYLRDELWILRWKTTPEATDRFVAASTLTESFEPCETSAPYGEDEAFAECETAHEHWLRPDGGSYIDRRVTRGQGHDGSFLVQLTLVDPN